VQLKTGRRILSFWFRAAIDPRKEPGISSLLLGLSFRPSFLPLFRIRVFQAIQYSFFRDAFFVSHLSFSFGVSNLSLARRGFIFVKPVIQTCARLESRHQHVRLLLMTGVHEPDGEAPRIIFRQMNWRKPKPESKFSPVW
jgi:hypothetical protein